jgi:large subunit ribosomal protein L3
VKLLIGRKLGMTQVFDPAGTVTPVTVLEVGPCEVVQVKDTPRDQSRAAQIGFLPQIEKRVKKPQLGHFRKAGVKPYRVLRDSPLDPDEQVEPGQVVKVDDLFTEGVRVDVVGTSKGRGFAGTIKRHGFSRGPTSHGSKNIREPGSTGAHTFPGRVFKGKKMPGHMGARRTTVKNLVVVRVDADQNRLLVRGAVPGPTGGIVYVQSAVTPPPEKKG